MSVELEMMNEENGRLRRFNATLQAECRKLEAELKAAREYLAAPEQYEPRIFPGGGEVIAAPQPTELTEYNVRIAAELEKLIDERDALRAELEAAKADAASWRSAAEYWYGQCRVVKGGDTDYPVDGALDAWFKGMWIGIREATK